MIGVMRTLAVDLGADGIAVTAVAAGLTDTPIARSVNDPGQIEAVAATQAMKRALIPEDRANAVAFLASDGAEAKGGAAMASGPRHDIHDTDPPWRAGGRGRRCAGSHRVRAEADDG